MLLCFLQIDREQWEMEYQQVAPKLQIRVAAEARDWRTHLEAALQDKQGLVKLWPDSQTALKHVQQGILEQLEKVEDRENYLNNEFASRTDEYRNKKEIFIQKQVRSSAAYDGLLSCLIHAWPHVPACSGLYGS